MEKKWPPPRYATQSTKPQTTPARAFKPAAAPPLSSPRANTPSAPPVYRPEVKTTVAQQKTAPAQQKTSPSQMRAHPPVHRPGAAPKAVQAKLASPTAHAVRPNSEVKRPAPPKVYNPQPTPRVLQTKASVPGRSGPARISPSAPPVFRPNPMPKCLQMKSAVGRPQRGAQAGGVPAPPVYKPPLPRAGVQMKQARPAHGPLQGVVQRVKIYSKDSKGGTGEIADLKNSKTGIRDYVKAASNLHQASKDFQTSLAFCENDEETELINFGIGLIAGKLGGGGSNNNNNNASPQVDLSGYMIGTLPLTSALTLLSEWDAKHPKKGPLKTLVQEALDDLQKVMAAPTTLNKALHDKIAEVIIKVKQADGVKGSTTVTAQEKEASKKAKAKAKAKASITPEQEFEAYADKIISDIEAIAFTGNRGLNVSEPSGTIANADALADALLKYHNQPATWAPGGDVRYFIVHDVGTTKIDITGHVWKDGNDTDYGKGTNVFNYHLNW